MPTMATTDIALSGISGLGKLSIELLETVGIDSLELLARANADTLYLELQKANDILEIRKTHPTTKEVVKWIQSARDFTGYDPESDVVKLEVDEEVPKDEVLMAIPVPAKQLVTKGVKTGDVAVMETVELKVVERSESKKPAKSKPVPESKSDPLGKNGVQPEVSPLEGKPRNLRTTASEGLNAGKKEHSRSYIRGVLHPQIWQMKVGAAITIFLFMTIPAALGCVGMIVYTKNLWWTIGPAVFLFAFILYLMLAAKMKCRVCGQPVFFPKACRKHVKAHHISLLGYILPASVHMFLFHWFRCTYCGTSVRLKE